MASQNEENVPHRRKHPSKSQTNAEDVQEVNGAYIVHDGKGDPRRESVRREDEPSSSTARAKKSNGSARPSRAASPSAAGASMSTPNTPTDSMGQAGFAAGEDFIPFDFSDDEEREDDLSMNHSPGKGKGKEREPVGSRDRNSGLKRTASEMEADWNRLADKRLRINAGSRPTPWAKDVDWDGCRNLAEMMHEEVKAFVSYISPKPEEHAVRCMIVGLINHAIVSSWPDAQVVPFGSFATKLYLPLGDIDLVILSDIMGRYDKRRILYNLANVIRKANITDNVTVIAKAKVPIIKFVTSIGRFAVDISLNQGNGLVSARIINRFLLELPALRSLVLVIKLFLSQRSMNEVYTGGLGSYAIVCLAISFLQMHPKIRSAEINPSENLGVLVMEFFELYGHYFNYDKTGISIRDGGTYFNKRDRGWVDNKSPGLLSIEDPNDISNDISKNSYNIPRVRKTLAGAHEVLMAAVLMRARILASKAQGEYTRLRPPGNDPLYDNPSILGSVMGMTKESLNHRRMVQQLYEDNLLQNVLGLAPYQPTVVASNRGHKREHNRDPSPHRHSRTSGSNSRSAKAVESAWEAADMDLDTDDESTMRRPPSPEVEESRYSNRQSRKRRKLDTNRGPQEAIYVADSEEENLVGPQVAHRAPSMNTETLNSNLREGHDIARETKRAYWASKGMSVGGGLNYGE